MAAAKGGGTALPMHRWTAREPLGSCQLAGKPISTFAGPLTRCSAAVFAPCTYGLREIGEIVFSVIASSLLLQQLAGEAHNAHSIPRSTTRRLWLQPYSAQRNIALRGGAVSLAPRAPPSRRNACGASHDPLPSLQLCQGVLHCPAPARSHTRTGPSGRRAQGAAPESRVSTPAGAALLK